MRCALGEAVTLAFLREGATCAVTMLNPEHGRTLEDAAGEFRDRLSIGIDQRGADVRAGRGLGEELAAASDRNQKAEREC